MTMVKGRLAGHVALVTGSGRNIGRGIAKLFAAEGASVVVNGHSNAANVNAVVAEITDAGGKAIGVMADVADVEQVGKLFEKAEAAFGSVDIVVNNVGIRLKQDLEEMLPESWLKTFSTNLNPCYYTARLAMPGMREKGWGRFINISGTDGFGGMYQRPANVTCKAAMHGLSKALATDLGQFGITCNTVAVGLVRTERDWSQYTHVDIDEVIGRTPMRRSGEVEDIAQACLYLASDAAGYVTGHALHVNGGIYMV